MGSCGKISLIVSSIFLVCGPGAARGQDTSPFLQVYPVGERPSLRYMTPMVDEEKILFEANPNVRYAFYNSIYELLGQNATFASAAYLAYRPQLRMYTDQSKPVKMPSYRIALGGQAVFRVWTDDLITVGLESGHYSNGQSGCAFDESADDGTAECDAAYASLNPASDLSELLNRRSGEFSTNFSELVVNTRFNKLDRNYRPKRVHSVTVGTELYHDNFLGLGPFGGYNPADLPLYGRWRLRAGYEYERDLRREMRLSVLFRGEQVLGADERITPYRATGEVTVFRSLVGITLGGSIGHDNYNIRFVDSRPQAHLGLSWQLFPPFEVAGPID